MNFSNNLKRKAFILIIAIVFFYALILLISDLNKIVTQLSSIRLEYYLPIFSITAASLFISGWRYQLILKKLGIQMSYKDCFTIFVAGLSMLITPAGSGAMIKSYILKKKIGTSISSTTPIIIYEKWLEFVSIIVVIGVLLFWANFLASQVVFVIGVILIGASFFIFRNSKGLDFINKLLTKFKFLKQFEINIAEFKKTTATLTKPSAIAEFLSLSIVKKSISLVSVFLVFESLNSGLDFFSSGQIFFTSTLIGVLSFIPGGIIVTETSMLGMMLNNNVDFSSATVLVLMLRLVTTWIPVTLGFIVLKKISAKILND